jgi:hypothetical protein
VVLLIATVWLAEVGVANSGLRFGTYAISINEFKGWIALVRFRTIQAHPKDLLASRW